MKLRLPGHVHTPGRGTEPDRPPLEEAKALVPERFAQGVPTQHPAVQFGVDLYEAGYFWEAHEVLEAVWKAAPMNGPDRIALRALIQLANAALKQSMGQEAAYRRLVAEALDELMELSYRMEGGREMKSLGAELDAVRLIADLQACKESATKTRTIPFLGGCKKLQRPQDDT